MDWHFHVQCALARVCFQFWTGPIRACDWERTRIGRIPNANLKSNVCPREVPFPICRQGFGQMRVRQLWCVSVHCCIVFPTAELCRSRVAWRNSYKVGSGTGFAMSLLPLDMSVTLYKQLHIHACTVKEISIWRSSPIIVERRANTNTLEMRVGLLWGPIPREIVR